jgi:hypothetical protein
MTHTDLLNCRHFFSEYFRLLLHRIFINVYFKQLVFGHHSDLRVTPRMPKASRRGTRLAKSRDGSNPDETAQKYYPKTPFDGFLTHPLKGGKEIR